MALKRDPSERGAALFLVVMIVVLLTAIGTFAIHATSLAQLSAGYSRRAASAFYLTELGMNLSAAWVGDSPDSHRSRAAPGPNQPQCRANASMLAFKPTDPVFCDVARPELGQVQQIVMSTNSSLGTEGIFGEMTRPDSPDKMIGQFQTEFTVGGPAFISIPGMPQDGSVKAKMDTISARGGVIPMPPAGVTALCTDDFMRATGQQSFLGYLVYSTTNSAN